MPRFLQSNRDLVTGKTLAPDSTTHIPVGPRSTIILCLTPLMFPKRPFTRELCLALLFITGISCLRATEWQWSVPVASDIVTAGDQREPARAFLWIPHDCAGVRCIVVASAAFIS